MLRPCNVHMPENYYNDLMNQNNAPHRRTVRLKNYDYSQPGAYFVTLCTSHRRQMFGDIHDGLMRLNAVGRLAAAQWLQLPKRFPDLELGEWVIMSNHIHGILVITGRGEASQQNSFTLPTTSDKDASPLRPNGTIPGSIGAIIQNYKSVVSRKIANQGEEKRGSIWQRNYYEHVIRNERELQAITDYILTNPQNWDKDTENQI